MRQSDQPAVLAPASAKVNDLWPRAMPVTLDYPTLGERIHYEADRLLSTKRAGRFILLGTFSGFLIVCGALLRILFAQNEPVGIFPALWWAMVRVVNTGTFASEETFTFAAIAFFCTLSGWFVVATLIGVNRYIFPISLPPKK